MHARVIGMESRLNAARKPIEREIREHAVPIDRAFSAAIIICPDLEFFSYPIG